MKFQIIVIVAVLSSVFFSCKESKSIYESDEAQTKISIGDIEKLKFGKFSDVFDSVRLVKLETTDESLIGRVDKIIFHDNRFFILDQVQRKAVLEFDIKGKFIKRFGQTGKGPGEYDEPNDIAINKFTNELVIWSNNDGKLLSYDLNGKFVKEIKTNYFAKSFAILDKDLIALYLDGNFDLNDPDDKYNLVLIDNDGHLVNSAFNNNNTKYPAKGNLYSFSQNESDLLISPGYSNGIYAVAVDTLKKKYSIDFGKNTIPKEIFTKSKNELDRDLNSKYAFLRKHFETSNHLVFEFVYNKMIYDCYYSKRSKVLKYANYYINNIHGILTGPTSTVYNDYVVSYYDPASIDAVKKIFKYPVDMSKLINETSKSFQSNDVAYVKSFLDSCGLLYTKEEIENIQSVDPSDNPILIVRKLKSF